jgi:hypothetical protein
MEATAEAIPHITPKILAKRRFPSSSMKSSEYFMKKPDKINSNAKII